MNIHGLQDTSNNQNNEIDLQTLADILNGMRRKSGEGDVMIPVIKEHERSIARKLKDKIRNRTSLAIANKEGVTLFSDTYGSELDADERIFTLVHEIVHTFGKMDGMLGGTIKNVIALVSSITNPGIKQKIGYANVYIANMKFKHRLLSFNEGMTDIISSKVIREYNKRTGNTHDTYPKGVGYEEEIENIQTFITYLEQRGYGSRQIILEGLIQGYFSGLDLIETLMDPVFGLGISEDFVKELLFDE